MAALVLAVWTLGNNSGSISVCANTGMVRHLSTYGPFRHERVEETPLSRVLVATGYRKPNEHKWLYSHGGGRQLISGPYSASGPALSMPGTVESPAVASVVSGLIAYTDKPTVEKWLARIFDPDVSPHVPFYIGDLAGQTNQLDFLRELTNSEAMFQMMESPKRK